MYNFPFELDNFQKEACECISNKKSVVVCAPTGAGKTNVALMTILHEMWLHRREDVFPLSPTHLQGSVDRDKFKIVYIAPMKALVKEMVDNFGQVVSMYLSSKIEIEALRNDCT